MEKIDISVKQKSAIIRCSDYLLKNLRDKFSVENPNYKERRRFPRKSVITMGGAFEIGMWEEIYNYLRSLNIPLKINISPEFKNLYRPSFKDVPIQNLPGFEYYDHQRDTIYEFLNKGRGCGILATSAGKSLIIAGFCKSILAQYPNYKILIIVPNISLLNQLYNSFIEEFDMPVITRWGDGHLPDLEKNIIIVNTQILFTNFEENLNKVKHFDVCLIDEVHVLGEKSRKVRAQKDDKIIFKTAGLLSKFVHNMETPHKFGLTGTLPHNLLAAWNIIGKIGPIVYEKSSYDIIKEGVATPVEIKVLICSHRSMPEEPDPNDPHATAAYRKELEFINTSIARNDLIKKIIGKLDGNCLILVDNLIQGETLLEVLQFPDRESYFIQGETATTDRLRITNKMEVQDNMVVIAMSKIFSTGISVKNLPYILFVSIGKSNIKISQSIGRSMRLHKNKSKSLIFDIADTTHYSLQHLKERLKIYEEDKIPFVLKKISL